jgi:PEGA domain
MTRGKLLLGTFAATLALSVTPALAQRSASSGESTGGSAASRGGGGDSGGGGAGSRGGDSGSGGSVSGGAPSAPSSAPSAGRSTGREYAAAPSHPSERAQGRSRGDGASRQPSGGRAVPRDSGSVRSGGGSTRSPGTSATGSNPSDRAVPAYSRPRDGRPATGGAVAREFPRIDRDRGFPYYPGYFGYRRYYGPGLGFGLGYFYDPFWYDPFSYGGGYYGGGYYGGAPYAGGYGSGSYATAGTGSLRLKLKPREAEVYVDGYFVGTVDQFDGLFQKLELDAGGHRIEIRSEGHESVEFDVLITAGETVTYKGELRQVQ